jgi:hypothetical protein
MRRNLLTLLAITYSAFLVLADNGNALESLKEILLMDVFLSSIGIVLIIIHFKTKTNKYSTSIILLVYSFFIIAYVAKLYLDYSGYETPFNSNNNNFFLRKIIPFLLPILIAAAISFAAATAYLLNKK